MGIQQLMLAQKIAAGGGTYYSQVMADSPLLYCRLKELSGTAAANEGSATLTGAWNNAAKGAASLCGDAGDYAGTFTTGAGIRAVKFTGAAGVAKRANNFTIEMLIRPSSVSGLHGIFINGSAGQPYLRLNGNKLNFLASQVEDLGTNTTSLSIDTKFHVAIRVPSSGAGAFYLNGVADGALPPGLSFPTTGTTCHIGAEDDSTDPFQGVIDEVAFYPTSLSAARILAHAQAAGLA